MKIFTNTGFEEIFEATIKAEGDGGVRLVERIASSVTCEIDTRWLPGKKRIIVFAGPGSNGSIALATARMLGEGGYNVLVYLFNISTMPISELCEINRDLLDGIDNVVLNEVTTRFDMPHISKDDVVLDGLFGTGLTSPLKGGYTMLVQRINESNAFVISIDTPTGLLSEWNQSNDRRHIIKANLTLALISKKLSFFFEENAEYVGTCKVLDVEFDQKSIKATNSKFTLVEDREVRCKLRKRNEFSHKYNYGRMLLAAGSYGMMGAAVLSARAALRTGVGLLTIHTPKCGFYILQNAVPEAINNYDLHASFITEFNEDFKDYDAVAIGPGLGRKGETMLAVDSTIKRVGKSCIIDADALYALSENKSLLANIPPMSILTPHKKEYERIFKSHNSDESRLREAIQMSRRYKVIIVLKGRYTMVVRPDEQVYINSTGGPALATAGSGDVLTGLIGGFMAQGYEPELSASMAVYVHGAAGDRAEQALGTYSVTASDIVDNIAPVIKDMLIRNENN